MPGKILLFGKIIWKSSDWKDVIILKWFKNQEIFDDHYHHVNTRSTRNHIHMWIWKIDKHHQYYFHDDRNLSLTKKRLYLLLTQLLLDMAK